MRKFNIQIPDEEDEGYMGFLDDLMALRKAAANGEDHWDDLTKFVKATLDYDDVEVVFRSMRKSEFEGVLAEIVELVSQKKASQETSNDKFVTLSPAMHKPTLRYGSTR